MQRLPASKAIVYMYAMCHGSSCAIRGKSFDKESDASTDYVLASHRMDGDMAATTLRYAAPRQDSSCKRRPFSPTRKNNELPTSTAQGKKKRGKNNQKVKSWYILCVHTTGDIRRCYTSLQYASYKRKSKPVWSEIVSTNGTVAGTYQYSIV